MVKKGTTQPTSPATEKTEKKKNGGAREGSGRKPGVKSVKTLVKEQLAERMVYHGEEEHEITIITNGKVEKVKKPRYLIILDALFIEAIGSGNKPKSVPAMTEYLNRVAGKALQPVKHSGSIDQKEQGIPVLTPAQKKARDAYHREILKNKDDEEEEE